MPNCIPCTSGSPIPFVGQFYYSQQCRDSCVLPGQCGTCCDAAGVIYNGPALTCSGIDPLDTLETIIQKLDEQICSVIGDYSTYQFNCLETWCSCTITTEAQFVDQITAYACETRANLDVFIASTFPAYQESLAVSIEEVAVPGITCATASIGPSNTLNEILLAYCTQITNIKAAIDVSSVDWDQCFTVGSPPSTIIGGFDLLVDQICEVKATANAAAVLPVFNNTAYTCLSSPGASDTLVATITKILNVLCGLAEFDPANVDWGCTGTEPADLETGVQQLVDSLDILLQNNATYSADFIVTPTNVLEPCDGVTISLATPINQDRFVASNSSDTSPGTLVDKITAGSNITLDDTTTPGQLIIASTGETYTVKANAADTTPSTLDDKVEGDTDGVITIATSYNAGDEKVQITPSIDANALLDLIFSTIEASLTFRARLCALVESCVPGDACIGYQLSNGGGLGDPAGTYSYIDCDGVFQSGSLTVDDPVLDICAIGGVTTDGIITIVNMGDCSGGTTTTTTTAAP